MTMTWNVSCRALAIVMAVSAAMAGEPGKDESGGSPPARKVPTVNYIVASPRAYLAGAATERAIDYSAMAGAAENFARPAVAKARVIEVPVGTRVVFSLDPLAEGVWMQGAHGMIRTLLTLQRLVVKDCAECDAGAAEDANDAAPAEDSKWEYYVSVHGKDGNDVAPPADPNDKIGTRRPVNPARWVTLATDGARDIRFGPSLGRAGKVGVPVRFDKPGVYCLRSIISTSVRSWHPRTAAKLHKNHGEEQKDDMVLLPDRLLAVDVDIVHVAVRVVDRPAKDADKTAKEGQEETTDDQDVMHAGDMPDVAETEAFALAEDSFSDLGVLVGQQEGDFVLPAEDENIGN